MSEQNQPNTPAPVKLTEPVVEEKAEQVFSRSFLAVMGSVLFVSLLAAGLFVWSKSQPPRYVVVDLVQVTGLLKDAARKKALGDKVTDEQRGLILEQYKRQMTALQNALDKEAERCRCSVFVKSAIVADGAGAEDITARIERQLQAVK